ncbi:SdrD B-like domain protein [uncultured archaeon]|nr:SdrD B-like domain protein [uncultured archaeon]
MKKWIVALGICTLLACSTLTITVAASEPTVRLPGNPVYMTSDHDGTTSWFDFYLSEVPAGYEITNGVYPGWCVQKYKEMANGSNPVLLKSCYATDLPSNYKVMSWDKINYIINHRQGKDRVSVQLAIWYFTDNINISTYPTTNAIKIAARTIINDTILNGPGYIPQSGDILAIPIIGAEGALQLAFLELTISIPSTFEGLVWYDTNANGIQNGNEPGIKNINVSLYLTNNTLIQYTTTNTQGIYSFANVLPGEYYLKFKLLTDYTFSPKDVGSDDTLDSDAAIDTGKTIVFPVSANASITIWDAGMYKSSGGTPTPPEPTPTNIRPKADAGGHYKGFINTNIIFNGSHSYDYDGRIITWRWNFGDGTNATGEITTHVYTLPGDYTVTLLVTDNKFATDMNTTNAHITLGNNPPSIPSLSGPLSGNANVAYQYTVVLTDPDEDNLRYIIDWGDGVQGTSPFIASGNNIQTTHQWNAAGIYKIQVYAQDTYNATSATYTLAVPIDVHYTQNLGYLIDGNGDGIYDTFHSNATGTETSVKHQTNGKYLIDSNGDGTYDQSFDTTTGQTQKYSEQPLLEYGIIILVILVIAALLIFYLMKRRNRP